MEFHGHNDFGLAVSNTLTALQSGAEWVSTTVLGIGEGAGNANMESVALAADQLLHYQVDLSLTGMLAAAQTVASMAQRQMPVDQPVVGASIFTHESGIHVDGTLKARGCWPTTESHALQTASRICCAPSRPSGREARLH